MALTRKMTLKKTIGIVVRLVGVLSVAVFNGVATPTHAQAPAGGGANFDWPLHMWTQPAIDPELGLVYVNAGNPSPAYDGSARKGINLFYELGPRRQHADRKAGVVLPDHASRGLGRRPRKRPDSLRCDRRGSQRGQGCPVIELLAWRN
jgi:hypothetical protein